MTTVLVPVFLALLQIPATSNPDLDGVWKIKTIEQNDKTIPLAPMDWVTASFKGKSYVFSRNEAFGSAGPFDRGTFVLSKKTDFYELDFIPPPSTKPAKDSRILGILKVDGDTMKMALSAPGKPRPETFNREQRVEVWARFTPTSPATGKPEK